MAEVTFGYSHRSWLSGRELKLGYRPFRLEQNQRTRISTSDLATLQTNHVNPQTGDVLVMIGTKRALFWHGQMSSATSGKSEDRTFGAARFPRSLTTTATVAIVFGRP